MVVSTVLLLDLEKVEMTAAKMAAESVLRKALAMVELLD